jgi:DnaK suppressor protein
LLLQRGSFVIMKAPRKTLGREPSAERSSAMPRPPLRRAPLRAASSAGLTAGELDELHRDLEKRRIELVEAIEARRQEERRIGASREVGDEMDEAASEGTASLMSKLLERDMRMLVEIDHALTKFADGTYGICEGTDEPISYERLRLRPWVRYSVAHQEELEQEARRR